MKNDIIPNGSFRAQPVPDKQQQQQRERQKKSLVVIVNYNDFEQSFVSKDLIVKQLQH